MSKECKHEEWNPCGNDFYSCRKCGILRTSQQVNLYAEKDRQIADLEAKLAEAQKTIEIQKMSNDALIDENLDYRYDITDTAYEQAKYMAKGWEEDYQREIAELKQQLAEWQDGTIICKWTDAENKVKELEHQIAEKEELIMFADRTIKGLVLAKEIDKISFCIDKLEQVKSEIDKRPVSMRNCGYGNFDEIILDDVYDVIDNQIEELKRESNNG